MNNDCRPPATWADQETCEQFYYLFYGFKSFDNSKEQSASIETFGRGWKAGASAAARDLWRWLDKILFHREAESTGETPETLTDEQARAVQHIEIISKWLAGTGGAIENGGDPDVIIRLVCNEGSKQLRGILDRLKDD